MSIANWRFAITKEFWSRWWRGHPEEDKGARAGVLTVRTGKDCLLVAVNAKDEALLRYIGDHLGCESV